MVLSMLKIENISEFDLKNEYFQNLAQVYQLNSDVAKYQYFFHTHKPFFRHQKDKGALLLFIQVLQPIFILIYFLVFKIVSYP